MALVFSHRFTQLFKPRGVTIALTKQSVLCAALTAAILLGAPVGALGAAAKKCTPATIKALGIDVEGDSAYGSAATTGCKYGSTNQYPMPDSTCTPGAYNPSITLETLKDPRFRTPCLRNQPTSEKKKGTTYTFYSQPHPAKQAANTRELDHLVPLELGGADTLDNIWPQCGTAKLGSRAVYFRTKDAVETCIAKKVRAGTIDLDDARKRMAQDWTQFLSDWGK